MMFVVEVIILEAAVLVFWEPAAPVLYSLRQCLRVHFSSCRGAKNLLDSCGCCDCFSRILGCLQATNREMPLAPPYFLEAVVLDR